jgi:hypothetical protein
MDTTSGKKWRRDDPKQRKHTEERRASNAVRTYHATVLVECTCWQARHHGCTGVIEVLESPRRTWLLACFMRRACATSC